MSNEYMPTTEDVRFDYATTTKADSHSGEARARAFNRWLAQVKAEAFEAGVRSAVDAVNSTPPSNLKPYLRGAEQ